MEPQLTTNAPASTEEVILITLRTLLREARAKIGQLEAALRQAWNDTDQYKDEADTFYNAWRIELQKRQDLEAEVEHLRNVLEARQELDIANDN